MKQKWPCVSIALFSLHNIVMLFHTISMCPPFSCPPSPCWGIRHVDHANRPSFPPSTSTHFPSLPVHVEQGRAVAAAGIRHVSSPQRPSPIDWYTCVRTIQLRWAMTSDKHFGKFLCLTALGIDTNLVPSYDGFYTPFIYCMWGITDFFSRLAAFCQRLHYALHFLSFLCFYHHMFLCEAGYNTIPNSSMHCHCSP